EGDQGSDVSGHRIEGEEATAGRQHQAARRAQHDRSDRLAGVPAAVRAGAPPPGRPARPGVYPLQRARPPLPPPPPPRPRGHPRARAERGRAGRTATQSFSTLKPARVTPTVVLAGRGWGKACAYTLFISAKSAMSAR